MKKDRLVPKRRFKEFENAGDWEQRKLEDIVEFWDTQRKPLEEAKREKGQYPYYGASGIVDYVSGYLFDEELILLSEDGANITDRNYPVCFLASGKYWVNNHAHVLKAKEGNDNNFICNSMERKDFTQYNTGMAMPKLNQEVCRRIPVFCPKFEEQKKIGDYFRHLDHLITLHQRKLNKLQNIKKAYLSEMFPTEGERKPKRRFAGFTDDWEQRKLGEIIKLNGRIGFRGYTEKDIVTKEEGGVLTFSPTNIVDNKLTTNCKNTYITRFKYDESPEIKVHNGDILFVKTGSTLGKSALISGLSEDATLNPQVVVIRVHYGEEEFISASLITENILSQVSASKIGGAVPTLTETKIKDFNIAIPQAKEEKQKIGSYFRNLDHLITLHQRKLEKLKNLKKAYLEELFV